MSDNNSTTTEQCEQVVAAAAVAAVTMRRSTLTERASWLDAIADAMEQARDSLVGIAMRESHLPAARLHGELGRTTFQLRLFAEEVMTGDFLGVRIDRADPDWGMGPRPEMRRTKRPIGPVVVFAASNFPFAFSVAGGDFASALSAGCPVIVKAHEAHPELSRRTAGIVNSALIGAGAPNGAFGLIEGRDVGLAVLADPRVAGGGFTGSIRGGRALYDVAVGRDVPIPFYAEMGSVNPVVVTPAAAAARAREIVDGLVASMTLGVGQFCTKPGLVFIPDGSRIEEELLRTSLPAVGPMLTDRMADAFAERTATLSAHAGVKVLSGGRGPVDPVVFVTDLASAAASRPVLLAECFGPSSLLVRYRSLEGVTALLTEMDGQLTGTVFGERDDDVSELVDVLAGRAGRILWNSWPTGVSVTHAQQHGGPYPATSIDNSTSVGTAAIERWLRPVAYQNVPEHLLPPPVQDINPWSVTQTVH